MQVSAFAKTIVALVAVVVTAIVAAVTDGAVSSSEVVMVVLELLGALGVYAVPNSTTNVRS